jgi:hypothetical protein
MDCRIKSGNDEKRAWGGLSAAKPADRAPPNPSYGYTYIPHATRRALPRLRLR